MSIPFNTFSCSRCELSGTNLITAGYFSYREGDAVASIPRSCGYCAVCDSIVPVETLTSRKIDWNADDTENNTAKGGTAEGHTADGYIAEGENNVVPRRWWHRLFAMLLPGPRDSYAATRNKLANAEERFISRIAEIGRAPVCLRCGAEDILPLPLPAEFVDDGSLFRIGVFHPDCGGQFLVNGSNGARLQPELAERMYEWRTGRQISGPVVEIEPPLLSGFWPGERPQKRGFDI